MSLQDAIRENLIKVLKNSNAITSPECLKHSIMRAQMTQHWAKQITPQFSGRFSPTDIQKMCEVAFDNAVDDIYTAQQESLVA